MDMLNKLNNQMVEVIFRTSIFNIGIKARQLKRPAFTHQRLALLICVQGDAPNSSRTRGDQGLTEKALLQPDKNAVLTGFNGVSMGF